MKASNTNTNTNTARNPRGVGISDNDYLVIRIDSETDSQLVNGSYQEDLLYRGHIPGVLSGAELEGKARLYSSSYKRSRKNLESRVFELFQVWSDLVLIKSRWARVWVTGSNDRVKFIYTD